MSDRLWQRLGAASGVIYVVLLMVGNSISGGEESPTAEASARAFAEAARSTTIRVSFALEILGFLCFLLFLGSLWGVLRRAEGEYGWLSATAFGGGLVSLTIKLASAAPIFAALHRANEGLDPQIARMLDDINGASFLLSFFPLAVLLGACAIAVLRYGTLPHWLGWMAAVFAVALLGGGIVGTIYDWVDWAALPFLLFLLWTLVTSIVLVQRVGKPISVAGNTSMSLPPSTS